MRNAPDPIRKIVQEERALAILRLLRAQPGMVSNDHILARWCRAYGLACGHEELRAELGRLDREGLLTTERNDSLLVVALSKRGSEVAEGLVMVDGVGRPEPDCPY